MADRPLEPCKQSPCNGLWLRLALDFPSHEFVEFVDTYLAVTSAPLDSQIANVSAIFHLHPLLDVKEFAALGPRLLEHRIDPKSSQHASLDMSRQQRNAAKQSNSNVACSFKCASNSLAPLVGSHLL